MDFSRYFQKLSLIVGLAIAGVLLAAAPASAETSTTDGTTQGVTDSVVRLYLAVFDREPDQSGLDYWVADYVGGVGLDTIAQEFIVSPEWDLRYGSATTDAEFVDVMYANVLGRLSDASGEQYWLEQLAGGMQRYEMLLYFSEGAEFIAVTGTLEPVVPTIAAPIDSGSGRRIVYKNSDNRVWLIGANGRVEDSYLVSGRRETPDPGTYNVFSKSPIAYAGHDGITMTYMVRFTWGRTLAIGFHSIPTYSDGTPMQTLAELGTYQSAGCIRQDPVKAKALFEWADVGTKVVVLS